MEFPHDHKRFRKRFPVYFVLIEAEGGITRRDSELFQYHHSNDSAGPALVEGVLFQISSSSIMSLLIISRSRSPPPFAAYFSIFLRCT
jgi:hypothetical protein